MFRLARRAYSSSGGGRHIVSPKSPKPVLQPANSTTKPDPHPLSPCHPTIAHKDYKLHQFFSLHRPLLLLNQPTSAIFEPSDHQVDNGSWLTTIDNPPESSPEADADAARQLAHALVMNRVGGAIAWQQALSRLGKHSEDTMTQARETAQEWVTIHADSTRRKKRKKMKKHKLKKRRRLTRRQNK